MRATWVSLLPISILLISAFILSNITLAASGEEMLKPKYVVIPLWSNSCADGTKCGDNCVDTQNNPSYCGDCATRCGAGNFCSKGRCKIPAGGQCSEHSECISGVCIENACSEVRWVFVSSIAYQGNLGGVSGADAKCQILAEKAGLPGTYKAWISVDNLLEPKLTFRKSNAPYTLTNRTTIADDWNDLIDGTLDNRFNIDENGWNGGGLVWTNTYQSGDQVTTIHDNCKGYTSNSSTRTGNVGDTFVTTNGHWSSILDVSCDIFRPLYCFQQ